MIQYKGCGPPNNQSPAAQTSRTEGTLSQNSTQIQSAVNEAWANGSCSFEAEGRRKWDAGDPNESIVPSTPLSMPPSKLPAFPRGWMTVWAGVTCRVCAVCGKGTLGYVGRHSSDELKTTKKESERGKTGARRDRHGCVGRRVEAESRQGFSPLLLRPSSTVCLPQQARWC